MKFSVDVAIVSKQIFGSFKIKALRFMCFKTVSLFSFNFKCTPANSSTLADAFSCVPS
jgi:hypothetical protein